MINAERRLGKTVPIRAIPTVTRASDLFRRYHREQRQEVRKADVKEDKALAQLKEAWKEFNCRKRRAIVDEYEVAVSIVSSINYSSVDVGKFSIALTEFQEEKDFFSKAGLFLSALINNGKDASYTITTRHLEKPIKYLGFRNTKNITIIGDVGADAAYKMESGVMVINGNTGGGTGYEMQGGSLEINGNAGMRLGTKMKDGTISVKKDVRAAAGLLMQGGAIVINGNANDHLGGLMEGGNIVVKGNAENSVGFEMKAIADAIGDSFALAKAAQELPAGKVVIHCTVDFMAETTKILRPDLTVVVPSHYGGCGLADYVTGEQIRAWRSSEAARLGIPESELPLVLYINSYANAKAEADVICTSSNALKVVESLPHSNVLFAPDRNLYYSIRNRTTKNLIAWEGSCPIHQEFTLEMLETALDRVERGPQRGKIGIMVHPECMPEVLDCVRGLRYVNAVLSTGGMITFVRAHPEIDIWIIGTEIGLIESLCQEHPSKTFLPVYEHKSCDASCVCPYMKSVSIDGVIAVLKAFSEGNVAAIAQHGKLIEVPEQFIPRARIAIERMVAVGRGDGPTGY